ncbi:MAG: hypothetical protein K9M99_10570 [Candidatus Cloacimonetes bacterium]|nr:hypothetical protein [Candidatus Cloacimonadota bacterium]
MTCYQDTRHFQEALTYIQLAMDEADKTNFAGKHIIQMNISSIQYEDKNYPAALASFESSAKYFGEHNMQSYLADAYLNIG